MIRLLFTISAVAVLIPATLLAQESPQTRLEEFDPMQITGTTSGPTTTLVVGTRSEFGSLIEIRASFVDEIVASAAEIDQ